MMKSVLLGLLAVGAFVPMEEIDTSLTESEIVSEITEGEVVTSEPIVTGDVEGDIERWLSEWFDAKTVAMIMSYLGYFVALVAFAVKYIGLKKANNLTAETVANALKESIYAKLDDKMKAEFDKYMPKLVKGTEEMKAVLTDFAKVLALAQENTAESRVAILEILAKIGLCEKETIDEARQIIADEQAKAEETAKAIEERKAEVADNLDKIVEGTKGLI